MVASVKENDLISRDINAAFSSSLTLGERVADRIADFGGSWCFILTFMAVLFIWIIINSISPLTKPFDPFPFILLNLVLSCLAAIQAPVIMMSQNRQESKDRLRAEHDYQINLKAELEIRRQNEEIEFILHQWQELMAIQNQQLEMIGEIIVSNGKNKLPPPAE